MRKGVSSRIPGQWLVNRVDLGELWLADCLGLSCLGGEVDSRAADAGLAKGL